MFERYTERARRVIFFARYEASQFGSPYIETEHLLLGLLREDKALTNRFLGPHASVENISQQIESHTMAFEKTSTSVDLPLSNEGKRVLAYAAEEAERLGNPHIGTEHLLLGLLHEDKCFAAVILQERGLRLDTAREQLAKQPHSDVGLNARRSLGSGLLVTSVPPGADIEIDDAFYGQTPAELPLPGGERAVRIKLKGFQPWERKVMLLHGARQTLIATLEPLPS